MYPMNGPCCLLAEVDGVRILTNTTCEFIHRVSSRFESTTNVHPVHLVSLLYNSCVCGGWELFRLGQCSGIDVQWRLVEGV